MKEYVVQSGPLKITVIAECPRDAALEAMTCWREQAHQRWESAAGSQRLAPELEVRRRGQRATRCFSSVRMLAQVRGQSLSATWKQLLSRAVAWPN